MKKVSTNSRADETRIIYLRRGYMTGDARVTTAVGATMTVTDSSGRETVVSVAPADTAVELDSPSYGTCDAGARALDAAISQSMKLLFDRLLERVQEIDASRAAASAQGP